MPDQLASHQVHAQFAFQFLKIDLGRQRELLEERGQYQSRNHQTTQFYIFHRFDHLPQKFQPDDLFLPNVLQHLTRQYLRQLPRSLPLGNDSISPG